MNMVKSFHEPATNIKKYHYGGWTVISSQVPTYQTIPAVHLSLLRYKIQIDPPEIKYSTSSLAFMWIIEVESE